MPDHDFEKQIHQKMTELELRPSDTVWEEVEKRLPKKERRRRWLIWLVFLFLGLGTGGYLSIVYMFEPTGNKPSGTQNHTPGNATSSTSIRNATPSKVELPHKSSGIVDEGAPLNKITSRDPAHPENDKLVKPPVSEFQTEKGRGGNRIFQGGGGYRVVSRANSSRAIRDNADPFYRKSDLNNGTDIAQPVYPSGNYDEGKTASGADTPSVKDLRHADMAFVEIEKKKINTTNLFAGNINRPGPAAIKLQTTKSWSWAFTLEAGRTAVNNGRLNTMFASSAVSDVGSNYSAGNSGYYPPSMLKPGPGFSAGILAKRKLSDKLTLDLGLSYVFSSTTNKVGYRIDSIVNMQSSYPSLQTSARNFFQAGTTTTYTNRYHFIQVPVSLETRLTGNNKLPLFWNMGITLSRFVASNALNFDSGADIYYKDNHLFNKTQFGIVTGMNIRLFGRRAFPVQLGPQFQYGITPLLTKQVTDKKHLSFLSLRAEIQFGKK